MTEQRIGILSDTHLPDNNKVFKQQAAFAFESCDTIIHAGDLTDLRILEVFQGKTVFAVHGNMCGYNTKQVLPESLVTTIAGFKIAVCHGAGIRHNIEERLFARFHDADCIIYGHTHQQVAHRNGGVLYVNPGSFLGTGRYGSPGTYAVLTAGNGIISANLQSLPIMQ